MVLLIEGTCETEVNFGEYLELHSGVMENEVSDQVQLLQLNITTIINLTCLYPLHNFGEVQGL